MERIVFGDILEMLIVILTNSNSNSNHLLIPNAHTTNILSNKHNMAILGYHQDKIVYKLV